MKRQRSAAIAGVIVWVAATVRFAFFTSPPFPEGEGVVSLAGLPNFHRVTDELYRGAQPSARGIRSLEKMGIKTIVNLRHYHSDRWMIEDTGLNYVPIPIKGWHGTAGHVYSFLDVITDKSKTPVFVHCMNGADRTGFICAAYRMIVCGWTLDEATAEMKDPRFGEDVEFRGLFDRLAEVDVHLLRRRFGLPDDPRHMTPSAANPP